MPNVHISNSKYLWGLQCPKLLWHAYNAKNLIPEPDAAQQAILDQGHEVGAPAKQPYPEGVEVGESVTDLDETLRVPIVRAVPKARPEASRRVVCSPGTALVAT